MIKLSVNETKWSSLLARISALILYISIWIFYFGPVKLPGLSRNGPQARSVERFFSPLSRVIARKYEKALCACVSFCVCFFISDWRCINCNSFILSRIYKQNRHLIDAHVALDLIEMIACSRRSDSGAAVRSKREREKIKAFFTSHPSPLSERLERAI